MRKLFTISFLFLFINCIWAVESSKLNLEIGKTYTIETVTHIDTTKADPYRFWERQRWQLKPVSFLAGKEIYTIDAVLDYYQHVEQEKTAWRGWQESEVYETGYLMSYRSPKVFLNAYKIPIRIEITTSGEILTYDFSKYLVIKSPEGLTLTLGTKDQKDIEKYLASLFLRVPKVGSGRVKLINFVLSDSIMNCSTYTDINTGNSLSIDNSTGLIARKIHTYTNNRLIENRNEKIKVPHLAIYHQRSYYEKECNFPAVALSQYELSDTLITSGNVIIEGTLENRKEGKDSIGLAIFGKKGLLVPLDKNGGFRFVFSIDDLTEVQLKYPVLSWYEVWGFFGQYDKVTYSFKLAPGDKLRMRFDAKDKLILSAIEGVGKNEMLLQKDLSGFDFVKNFHKILVDRETEKLTSYLDLRNSTLALKLYPYRKLVDPCLYIDLTSQYPHQRAIKNNNSDIVNNTLLKHNSIYLKDLYGFFDHEMDAEISNLTGVDYFDNKNETENNYYMAQISLAEPVKSHYLAYYVKNAFRIQPWDLSEQLYLSFKRGFSDTPVFTEVEKEYQKYKKISPGAKAPDFTLPDIYGTLHQLKEYRGKVVLLSFHLIAGLTFEDNIEYQNRLVSDFKKKICANNKDFIEVHVLWGKNQSFIERLVTEKMDGVYLIDNALPLSSVCYSYQSIYGSFLIDRNGIIHQKMDTKNTNSFEQCIQKALAIPYQRSFNNLPIWIRIALIALPGALLAVILTFFLYRAILRRRLAKSNLNKRMRELELTAIRAQMNPHFMYNCLNSIQNLVQKKQNDEAHLYLSKFASLIRRVLNTSKKEEVSLHEELETIREYVDLEKLRFDFDYNLVVEPGIDPVSVFVPPMLLQPFVENALLHGLLPKPDNRKLKIEIRKRNGNICIEIEDNGVGRSQSSEKDSTGNGKGLELSRERLKLMAEKQGSEYEMRIDDLTDENGLACGTKVVICFEEE